MPQGPEPLHIDASPAAMGPSAPSLAGGAISESLRVRSVLSQGATRVLKEQTLPRLICRSSERCWPDRVSPVNEDKTRIVSASVGFDFLGVYWVYDKPFLHNAPASADFSRY
jgi:hypothetical protein